ncbi:Hypothetical protein GLP15_5221 [Giardia lamblia P15]|uniref:Uncharacterized protein n=1 Tax=Giardia intestinalis (strain P15) TaxID=658858 RepID=E1EWF0_GIAIA|nr:Hypothetical protein GLP15_5221 [Giardia lamblia P15]
MSQGNYQFDSSGVRFSKKLTIEMVGQFITQFLHYRDARDAYLTHEAVLQYLQSEPQNNSSDRPNDKEKKTKTAIQAIGEKMSLAVKNMPPETSPYDVVSLLSTLCGYFEITPFLMDPEFELVVNAFYEAFKKVWNDPASSDIPRYPEKVKSTIPYYFSVCYAESGMPAAPLGHVYIPETRMFPGLILGDARSRDLLDCSRLAPGSPMSIEKLKFISELFQYASADFFRSTEMLTLVASVLGYALFTGNIDIFVQDDEESDTEDNDDVSCRAFSFLMENLTDGSSVSTDVILSFWAGAGAAVQQVDAEEAASGTESGCLPIKHESMMQTLETLVSFFEVFSLTNIRTEDLHRELVDSKNSSLGHFNDLCTSFFKTIAACYQFAEASKPSSDLGAYTFNKVSSCCLTFCIQRIMILLSTASADGIEDGISDAIERTLLLYSFSPAQKEFLGKFLSVEDADETLIGSITTSIAHRFAFVCNSMQKSPSCLFYTGNSAAVLPLLWNLYLATAEILEPSVLSETLRTYLVNIKATESFSITTPKSLFSLALSAFINDVGDCEVFSDVYHNLKSGTDEEKRVYLSYLLRKLQVSHNLSAEYTTRIRDELKGFEAVSAPHCKLSYALLSALSPAEIADNQIDLLSPDGCNIVDALISFRKNYHDSNSISRHLEKFLRHLVDKDTEKMLLPLFRKKNLGELTVPEVDLVAQPEKEGTVDSRKDDAEKHSDSDDSSDEDSDSSNSDKSSDKGALMERFKNLSLQEINYYFRRTDITHLSALLEILYVSIHHTDGVSDYLVMNVLVPLLLRLVQMMFAQYSSLMEALDVSREWGAVSASSKGLEKGYTSGERRLAVIIGWMVCIVDRLGEIYDYSTILWSILKLNADQLKTTTYDFYIHNPKESFVPLPLAIVVAYLLTIIASVNIEQTTDDLLYLAVVNLRLSGNHDLDRYPERKDILDLSQASVICKRIAPFFAAQLAPLKEKAQECVITSYAVIAMEITSDVTDSKKKKSQTIMKKAQNIFRIISALASTENLSPENSSRPVTDAPLVISKPVDPLERNYAPAGVVSDRFYIALLELVTDAYRDGCEVMEAIYSTTISSVEYTTNDLKVTSGYRIAYLMGVIAIIVHDTGAFPKSPYYSEKQIGNLLHYALTLKDYFTNPEESYILANAIQIICNYLVRFETYEHSELKHFVDRMKDIRNYVIPKDASLETLRLCYNLKEVSCASLIALADNKAFSGKHGMKPLDDSMKKTLDAMMSLPWENRTAAEIASHLLGSMVEHNIFSTRKNRAMFDLVTSVIEYLGEVLEESDMDFQDDDY